MMKSEFENLLDRQVTEEQYMDIEMVYMYYPGIETKEQIAQLYKIGGDPLINDMMERAFKVKELEERMQADRMMLEALKHK